MYTPRPKAAGMISAVVLALVAHLSLSHAQTTAAKAPAPSMATAPAPAAANSAVISLLRAADVNASLNPMHHRPQVQAAVCCSGCSSVHEILRALFTKVSASVT